MGLYRYQFTELVQNVFLTFTCVLGAEIYLCFSFWSLKTEKILMSVSGLPWESVTSVLYGFSSMKTLPHRNARSSVHLSPQT